LYVLFSKNLDNPFHRKCTHPCCCCTIVALVSCASV
jgi:hypothetical protein